MRRIAEKLSPGRLRDHFPQPPASYRMELPFRIMREEGSREGRRMHISRDIAGTEKDRMWRF